jgi:uncharacterized metal-binding protein YceD (DUF177 family)
VTPEFSRPHRLDRIGAGDTHVEITADEAERAALARRFDLVAIDRLDARFALRRDATGIVASGRLSGAVTQSCVATGDPVPAAIDEDFRLRFFPEPGEDAPEEVELDADDCDAVFSTGGAVDLGKAAAETLVLALDPFPRSARAAETLRQAGVLGEDEAGPFGALAGLKDKLERDRRG